jgi:hypothetical protein
VTSLELSFDDAAKIAISTIGTSSEDGLLAFLLGLLDVFLG